MKYLMLCLTAVASGMVTWGIASFSVAGGARKRKREVARQIVDDLKPNQPVHVADAGAWLVKRDEQQIDAFDDRCPHLGCHQNWNPQTNRFECPCHGSIFDADGNVQQGPATSPMPRLYLTSTEGNEIRLVDKPPASRFD